MEESKIASPSCSEKGAYGIVETTEGTIVLESFVELLKGQDIVDFVLQQSVAGDANEATHVTGESVKGKANFI